MPVISDTAITRIANWATTKVLKDSCDILRETRVPTSSGGFTITYPTAHAAVPCVVLNTGTPHEQLIAENICRYMHGFVWIRSTALVAFISRKESRKPKALRQLTFT